MFWMTLGALSRLPFEGNGYGTERGLNRSVLRALAQESCWVKNHEHIFVLGPTGVGKSGMVVALNLDRMQIPFFSR
jgi:DNA replication protein DnaC